MVDGTTVQDVCRHRAPQPIESFFNRKSEVICQFLLTLIYIYNNIHIVQYRFKRLFLKVFAPFVMDQLNYFCIQPFFSLNIPLIKWSCHNNKVHLYSLNSRAIACDE